MFNCVQGSAEFQELDRTQKVIKVVNNSIYGVMGESNSFLFNLTLAASITYTAAIIITHCVQSFESLFGNIRFKKVGDLIDYIADLATLDFKYYDTNSYVPLKSCDEVTSYLISKVEDLQDNDIEIVSSIISRLGSPIATRIYYKNNLKEFICDCEQCMDLIGNIIDTENQNIEKPSEELKVHLDELWSLIDDFVICNRVIYDRYEFSERCERKSVLLVDTDSCFLNLSPIYEAITNVYELEESSEMTLKIINVGIFILGKFVEGALGKLTENMNVPVEKQPIINMKNEFLYDRIMLTRNKKSYTGTLIAQEGHIIKPAKLDMKGLSVKKITVNRTVREFFTEIIMEDILSSKEIELSTILIKFAELEKRIKESLKKGEIDFCVPANVNAVASYKTPYQINGVRAMLAWNYLNPNNQILPPEKINTLKLKGEKLDDLQAIYDTSEFDIIRDKIFGNENLQKYGLKTIALPKSVTEIPEWIIPLIDIDTIVADNLRNGLILLETLGVKILTVTDVDYYSNIISL
jgi:DNA polymerase elongation subunit (family B)